MKYIDDDLITMLLQGKREFENLLQQNDMLKTKCHALEMQCERQREQNEGLHTGGFT